MAGMLDFGLPAKNRDVSVQILISQSGLAILGDLLSFDGVLSREFAQGITCPHRSNTLGDTGESAPTNWLWSDKDVDIVLLLYASCEEKLKGIEERVTEMLPSGCEIKVRMRTRLDLHEPFGFRDGVSNPLIDLKNEYSPRNNQEYSPAGDYVFGSSDSTESVIEVPDFAIYGSFVVVRQIVQDVELFWNFWRSISRDENEAVWLASKSVGRWPNGMPLTDSAPGSQPTIDERVVMAPLEFGNDKGDTCPMGAHIRRANPRDGLPSIREKSEMISRMHRLLRRGRVFGPPQTVESMPESTLKRSHFTSSEDESHDRGLLFLGICTDLSRQFEFIQQNWFNNPKHVFPAGETDILAAGCVNEEITQTFTIPSSGFRRRLECVPRFTRISGGGYFFLPSRQFFTSIASH
jgi:Dyp-type peroxidase family